MKQFCINKAHQNFGLSLTGHDGGSLGHFHVRFGQANWPDKRIIQRRSVQS